MSRAALIRPIVAALLLAGAAPALLPAAAEARTEVAAAAANASATRDGDRVTLQWQGLTGPVSIWQLPSPGADRGSGRRVARHLSSASFTVAVDPWPRPYFLIVDARGREVRTAERLLPFAGGSNFRDLGGYVTKDGATVQWGRLYRSAVMSGLTPDDFQQMGKLGIRTVCDFRSTDERARQSVTWPEGVQPTVLATDYGLDMSALAAIFQQGPVTGDTVKAAMADFYREIPFQFADQYARMFREMVEGRVPLAFNCSAGKDRTGVAAALILTVLGVPAETVMADYLLSNQYYQPKPPEPGREDPTTAMFARLPADAIQALMGVDAAYLNASFAAIEDKGGMDRYVAEQLKLSPADVAILKQRYLAR